ncbi:MAG: 2Fe-2S iron-sulfur cluster-binding protein [Nevskiales bacterium]|nr:2Fe-2S iron-sulfur cluster-binding protein [Nevskiales bacterium]
MSEAANDGAVLIRYVDRDGNPHDIAAREGATLMAVATENLIAGIGGDCGGCCACGTCRIRVDATIAAIVQAPDATEQELLGFLGDDDPALRLGCQLVVTSAFDGATVAVAEAE